jgi:NosR/NirI family nitrous oxide reductase transcriptional regulator
MNPTRRARSPDNPAKAGFHNLFSLLIRSWPGIIFRRMRILFVAVSLVLGSAMITAGQAPPDGKLLGQLKQLFPAASSFSAKEPSPPHFNAYSSDSSGRTLLGLAFWTTELEPLERGYDGPIKMLVGMDTKGVLTGVVVVEHREPYGYFSVDTKEFAAQFVGKSIRDPFKVGGDIDAISRASISNLSATRAIRNSARRVARQLLAAPAASAAPK